MTITRKQTLTLILGMVFLLMQASPALPDRAPPARIADPSSKYSCIGFKSSWLTNQPAAFGTFGKGPAVELRNNCEFEIVVSDLRTYSHPDGPITSRLPVKAVLHSSSGYARQTLSIDNAIKVPVGSSLTLPIEWGLNFKIIGKPDILLEGKMINPEDPKEAANIIYSGSDGRADLFERFYLPGLFAYCGLILGSFLAKRNLWLPRFLIYLFFWGTFVSQTGVITKSGLIGFFIFTIVYAAIEFFLEKIPYRTRRENSVDEK